MKPIGEKAMRREQASVPDHTAFRFSTRRRRGEEFWFECGLKGFLALFAAAFFATLAGCQIHLHVGEKHVHEASPRATEVRATKEEPRISHEATEAGTRGEDLVITLPPM